MSGSSPAPQPAPPNNFQPQLLANAIPSVSQGPYNVNGAWQNASALAKLFPWILPTSGAFAGANGGGGLGPGANPATPGFTSAPSALDPANLIEAATGGGKKQLNPLTAILAALATPTTAAPQDAGNYPGTTAPLPAYAPGSPNLVPGTP